MRQRLQSAGCAIALLLLCGAAPARAQIDLTGTFSFDFGLGDICQATVTQSGSDIDFLLQCVFTQAGAIGTIDPMTGLFSATGGCVVGPLVGALTMDGTAAVDSSSFSGTLSCPLAIPGGPHAFTGVRLPDDDPPDGCADAPATGCRAAGKSLLLLKDPDGEPSDKLTWKWLKGEETSLEDFGVPTGTSGYTLCIYAGTAAIAQADVPADAAKWRPIGDKGWKYKDPAGAANGIRKVLLKAGAAGKSKVLVKGKGEGLPDLFSGVLPVQPDEFPVSVQLLRDGTGECWESSFAESGVKANTNQLFKAKSP